MNRNICVQKLTKMLASWIPELGSVALAISIVIRMCGYLGVWVFMLDMNSINTTLEIWIAQCSLSVQVHMSWFLRTYFEVLHFILMYAFDFSPLLSYHSCWNGTNIGYLTLCLLVKFPHGLLGILVEVLFTNPWGYIILWLVKGSLCTCVHESATHNHSHEAPYQLRTTSQPFLLHHLENIIIINVFLYTHS